MLAASFFDVRGQGVSKVSRSNSYVDLEICMTIFQIELDTVLILAAWPVSVLIYHTDAGRSVFRSVFWELKNLAGTLKGLAGNPFFLKMGAGPLKKGAVTPLSRKKGVLAKGKSYMSPFWIYILANLGLFSLIRFVTSFFYL